jgi:isoaspartyl peptidase/L-asparaginase-like protein (Ntn-hydrolase superfamily)
LAHKRPGRVGDSPLIGHGLYVDDEAGAAGATGVGEEISRIVGSFYMTELMRSGKSAQEACEAVVKRVIELAHRRGVQPARVAFLALDREGGHGGACTKTTDFVYAVGRPSGVEIVRAVEM